MLQKFKKNKIEVNMKKYKNCHNDQISSVGGKLLLSKYFKHHLPENARLMLLRKYCVFKRNKNKFM